MDADAIVNANAGSSAIALPGLRPGELKNLLGQTKKNLLILRLSVFYFKKKSMKVAFYFHFGFKYIYLSIYLFIIPSC